MTSETEFDRLEAERLRRMAECWEEDRPTDAQVATAIERIGARSVSRTPRLLTALAVGVAIGVAGTVSLLSATGQLGADATPTPVAPAPEVSAQRSAVPASEPAQEGAIHEAFLEHHGKRTEVRDRQRTVLAPDEIAVLVVGEARTELVGPGVIEIRRAAGDATWQVAFVGAAEAEETPQSRRRGVGARAKGESAAAQPDSAWERAARALRERDSAAAEQAFGELSESDDAKTRDAALLARAQLQVADGRGKDARPTLERLAESGATPIIRKRAADLLSKTGE